MAKKFVVRRNLRKPQGGTSYLKYLVFSAIGLVFLVVITPYLLRDKGGDATKKRLLPESGAVRKELPQQAQQQQAPEKVNEPAIAGTTTEPGGPAFPATSPAPANPPQTQSASEQALKGVTASQEAVSPPQAQPASKPGPAQTAPGDEGLTTPRETAPPETVKEPEQAAPEKASSQAQPAEKAQADQKVLFPKKGIPSEGVAAEPENPRAKAAAKTSDRTHRTKTALSAKTAQKQKKPFCAPGAKSAAGAKPGVSPAAGAQPGVRPAAGAKANGCYAVQVGSVYKNLKQAESVRKSLTAKGYKASIRNVAGSGYLVVTSASSRSGAYTLKEQMNAQGLKNAKVVGGDAKPAKAGQR